MWHVSTLLGLIRHVYWWDENEKMWENLVVGLKVVRKLLLDNEIGKEKKDPWNNKFQFKFLTRFGLYPFSGKYSKNGRLPLIIWTFILLLVPKKWEMRRRNSCRYPYKTHTQGAFSRQQTEKPVPDSSSFKKG